MIINPSVVDIEQKLTSTLLRKQNTLGKKKSMVMVVPDKNATGSVRSRSYVAFSESEGEEIVDTQSVGSLQLNEMFAMQKKFLKICHICKNVKPPRVHHCS